MSATRRKPTKSYASSMPWLVSHSRRSTNTSSLHIQPRLMNKLSSPHGVWAGHTGTATAGCMASWSQILTKLHECATACKSAYREQCAFANMSAMARTLNLDHRPRWQSSVRRGQHAMPVDMARTTVRKCRTTAAIHTVKAGPQYYPQPAPSRPTNGCPSLAPTSISRGLSCCDRPH